ncbi:MAG TPA: ATP-binding protein, partial [Steroidobacteraceae bacterium]|nr:ATP-binding protein [Steroidobacteraceae bacterium]
NPGRDLLAAAVVLAIAVAWLRFSPAREFPTLNIILDTGAFLLSGVIAFLLWDMGWRTAQTLSRLKAVCFVVFCMMELLHVFTSLDVSAGPVIIQNFSELLRLGTLAPAAYLLPLGLLAALALRERPVNLPLFGGWLLVVGMFLLLVQQRVPSYSPQMLFGITRPEFLLLPFLWIPVVLGNVRLRAVDRLAPLFANFATLMILMPAFMSFSSGTADAAAMSGHFAKVISELFLLFGLMQLGTMDTARRMRAEQELLSSNEALEARVGARTAELQTVNADLRREVQVREVAEKRTHMQLERLDLLQRITHAIAERQDLESIFQVVVRSLEDHLPVDFAALCNYEHHARILTVSRVGTRSAPLALDLAMTERARIEIDENGLSRCVAGQLVYEPDIANVPFPFPQRLAGAKLGSMVIVPLMVEQRSGVFGVLVVARHAIDAFSSGDCEFLRQLCDHVSLAANQAQLHESLQQAYEDLQLTQNAILQHERLRALGQMASGIAHDINNAISPISLFTELLLEREAAISPRSRENLKTIQRSIEDVSQTVARMREFYRGREPELALAQVDLNAVIGQVLEVTRARWSDLPQRRGAMIELRQELAGDLPEVRAAESEVRDALINLVFNAADAMSNGGVMTIRSRRIVERGGTAQAVIEVGDTGVGMSEETRRRCMEPFFTTKGERGTGLGLAMVYGMAERHGATFEVDSVLGTGTTMRLIFPASAAMPQAHAVEPAAVAAPGPVERMRILVIDDDPVLLNSLRETLEGDGHSVIVADGGQLGIDAFIAGQRRSRPFNVVLTDLGMPYVDGRQVAAAIRAASPRTPIVMLTGWGRRLLSENDTPEHVDRVLSKPPKLLELRAVLADLAKKGTDLFS